MNNEVAEVAAETAVAEATTTSSKTSLKSGLVIGGICVVTLGAGYGVYRAVKYFRARRAAKKAAAAEETVSE